MLDRATLQRWYDAASQQTPPHLCYAQIDHDDYVELLRLAIRGIDSTGGLQPGDRVRCKRRPDDIGTVTGGTDIVTVRWDHLEWVCAEPSPGCVVAASTLERINDA